MRRWSQRLKFTSTRCSKHRRSGLKLTKECLNTSVDASSLEAAIAMENRNQVLTIQSPNFREGIQAFFEKRTPVFQDR